MNCVIIDDEPHAIHTIEELIRTQAPDLNLLGTARDIDAGRTLIEDMKPELVFLDVMLGAVSSFTMLKEIEISFKIIFTTGHQEFAFDAFKYKATHYLLKPVEQNSFLEAVSRVREEEQNIHQADTLKSLQELQFLSQKKIALATRTGIEIVLQSSISYCKGSGNYTEIYFVNGDKKLISKPLGFLEKNLNARDFTRVHKKYLINLNEVVFIEKGKPYVVFLRNGDHVTVSPHYRDLLLASLKPKISGA